jgi:rubrerythrin
MRFSFSADDILEVAERIERNGARFYRKAAELQEDGASRQLLADLATMEEGHEKTFAALRSGLSEAERQPTAFDPDDETGLYLQAMADGHIFDPKADPAAALAKGEPIASILRTAIGLEKDSVVFYQGVKEVVPERLGRDKVEAILREEVGHVGLLSATLATYSA